MKKLFAIIAIAALILPIILAEQAHAQSGKQQLQVWLKVTNTKTDTIHVTEWTLRAYQFEKNIPIDVPDFKVSKIKKIFGTDSLTFTFQKKVHQGNWLHFKVELGGTPSIGEVLSIKFV
jgi:hypothetical protein